MDDDEIQAVLAGLEPAGASIPQPPGTRVIVRSEVAAAGEVDLEEVDRWVREHGGQVRRTPPVQASARGQGRMNAQTGPGVRYYVIPDTVLE